MKNFLLFLIITLALSACSAGKNQDTAEDDVYWDLIERAWKKNVNLNKERELAISEMRNELIYGLGKKIDKFILSLERELRTLSKEDLTKFNRFVEKKLFIIDRAEIHRYTDGGDDGFYYARGFILAMGKEYFNKIDKRPSLATYDVESEIMCFVGYIVYKEKFNEEFERYKYHNASTGMNELEW